MFHYIIYYYQKISIFNKLKNTKNDYSILNLKNPIQNFSIQNSEIINVYRENNNNIIYLFKDFEIQKSIDFLFHMEKDKELFQNYIQCNNIIINVYTNLKKYLYKNLNDVTDIKIIGHGFGGTLALLFYLDLERDYKNYIKIDLYGVPRICNYTINDIIKKRKLNINNYIFSNDPILQLIENDYKFLYNSKIKDSSDEYTHSFQKYYKEFNNYI